MKLLSIIFSSLPPSLPPFLPPSLPPSLPSSLPSMHLVLKVCIFDVIPQDAGGSQSAPKMSVKVTDRQLPLLLHVRWLLVVLHAAPLPSPPLPSLPPLPPSLPTSQLVGSKELKSPVTALEAVDGQLLGCVCQKVHTKETVLSSSPFDHPLLCFTLPPSPSLSHPAQIYIWQFKDKEVTAVAFIDTDMYIHTVCALKNFILIADIMKNIKLLRYRVSTACMCMALPCLALHAFSCTRLKLAL